MISLYTFPNQSHLTERKRWYITFLGWADLEILFGISSLSQDTTFGIIHISDDDTVTAAVTAAAALNRMAVLVYAHVFLFVPLLLFTKRFSRVIVDIVAVDAAADADTVFLLLVLVFSKMRMISWRLLRDNDRDRSMICGGSRIEGGGVDIGSCFYVSFSLK